MISSVGLWVSRWIGRFLPDPFVIAILLTLLTFALALIFGTFPADPGVGAAGRFLLLLDSWRSGDGLWKFLAFSMQMCLILVTGHALAASPPVKRLLLAVASIPRGTASGASLVCVIACLCSLFNWGLGLIVGAVLARDVGRSLHARGIRAHYPLLVAAGFAGFMVWHGGLSGSAPLSMTTLESASKVLPVSTVTWLREHGYAQGIPLTGTILSPMNLFVTLGLVLLVPLGASLLAPSRPQDIRTIEEVAPAVVRVEEQPTPTTGAISRSFAERLDASRVLSYLLAALMVGAMWRFGIREDLRNIGLNEVNLTMLALGLVLHGGPRAYQAAIDEGARGCGGIILQFPLYGGILSMLVASGLAARIAGGLSDTASPNTLPVLVFLLAGVLNMFIPSGGGQWGVQGPIALEAGMRVGVDPGHMVMAVAYGDQLTNMLQVFWALPLLAITGVKARDIIGYTVLLMILGGAWITLGLFLF